MEIIKKNLGLIVFTFLVIVFSLGYVQYVLLHGGLDYVKNRSLLGQFGKSLGTFGFFALAIVYLRSALKIMLRHDEFWERLKPLGVDEFLDLKKWSVKIFIILNKTHAYFGVVAIVSIFLHCYLTGSYRDNFLLQVVLGLMLFEGISGFIMRFKYSPVELKKNALLIHRQFVVAILLLVFGAFGHLLLGD